MFNQFLYGEVTGIQIGHWLYDAPDVDAAKFLCEEVGAMCIGADSIGLEVMPWEQEKAFLPVHAENPAGFAARLDELLPHLGLIVSGGNTLLFTLDRARRLQVLAATRDDAAGEGDLTRRVSLVRADSDEGDAFEIGTQRLQRIE